MSKIISFLLFLCKKFFHFLPPVILYIYYATTNSLAIPFVEINPLAYLFVAILFFAGILLFFKKTIGGYIGIVATVISVILSYKSNPSILVTCSVICIYYIYCILEND